MKTIKILLLNLIALFIVSSCTIKHTINYNEDMSGNNELIIDYGEFIEQMDGLMGDSSGLGQDMGVKESMGDLTETFKNMDGLSNLKSIQKPKEGLLGFSFDFKDTKSLNTAMAGYLGGDSTSTKKKVAKTYVQKKKKLILNFDEDELGEMKASFGDESMMMMLGSIDYEFTVNFPVAIKSVNNSIYSLSANRKSMSATINLEDYLSAKESLSAKVKW